MWGTRKKRKNLGRRIEMEVQPSPTGGTQKGGAMAPPHPPPHTPSLPPSLSPGSDLRVLAAKMAAQPVQVSRTDVWGVLTAISDKARKRPQGSHIMLHHVDHILGRTVKEASCLFDSPSVSGRHCKISRRIIAADGTTKTAASSLLGPGERFIITVKDSSSNGTYVNHQRLRKDSPALQIQHGDIISLVAALEQENAFAFVYREVPASKSLNGSQSHEMLQHKRKGSPVEDDVNEDLIVGENKRMRGLGTGGPDGPVSLGDVRRLQRANEELRQQLEEHLLTIEKMRGEFRAVEVRHEQDMKEARSSLTAAFTSQIDDLRLGISKKGMELDECLAKSAQQQNLIEDLNQRLSAAAQSRVEAEETIQSHKGTISDLEKQLEEKRIQWRREQEEAESVHKTAIERLRAEAAEELKRLSEAAARQQKQHLDVVNALQDADKEKSMLVDSLRAKLEEEREVRMKVENIVRGLEIQLSEEKNTSGALKERILNAEEQLHQAFRELDGEKAAREVAGNKVLDLQVEMETAINNLKLEKQRLAGARERLVLRETQLRAFHSTAEQIALLQKQQEEQLKAMLKTLEDGDSDDHPNATNYQSDDESKSITSDKGSEKLLKEEGECSQHQGKGKEIKRGGQGDNVTNSDKGTSARSKIEGDTQDEMDCETEDEKTVIPTADTVDATAGDCTSTLRVDELSLGGKQVLSVVVNDVGATQILDAERPKESTSARNASSSVGSDRNTAEYHNVDTVVEDTEQEMPRDRFQNAPLGGETMMLDEDEEWQTPVVPFTVPVGQDHQYAEARSPGTPAFQSQNDLPGTRSHDGVPHHSEKDSQRSNSRRTSRIRGADSSSRREVRSQNDLPGTRSHDGVPHHSEKDSQRSNSRRTSRIRGADSSSRREVRSMCTADLLASEVAGSWALSTPASEHGNSDSSHSDEGNNARVVDKLEVNQVEIIASVVATSDSQRVRASQSPTREDAGDLPNTLESQNSPGLRPFSSERQVLHEMLNIVAPQPTGTEDASDSDDFTEEECNRNDNVDNRDEMSS